jgi:hypothetical protein
MDYGHDRCTLGARKGEKLEEILFSEPVLKKGIQILNDTRYELQRSTKPQSAYVRSMGFLRRLVI